ncbi:hypothetical protein KZ861_26260, partial [Pseudomonas aeruginosa]|uniref:hypothetical protein n=1 Tax=Pseudomonas aeruginosa TaxID=287 RepID=UPI001CA53CFE
MGLGLFQQAGGAVAGDFPLRPGEAQELGDDCEELVGVLNLYAGQRLIGPVPLITVRPVSLLRRPWCADPYRPAGV